MTRERIEEFARLLMDRPNAVLVWSMGLTQHVHGVDTIKALVNVGLARGLPGRPNRGLVPIRGHSGVQGGAEVGCVPKIDPATAARWAGVWGFPVPQTPGWTAAEMIDHARAARSMCSGSSAAIFSRRCPTCERSRAALRRPRLRVHQDIVLSSSMLVDSDGDVLLLPAATRYESPGGGTRDIDRAAHHLLAGNSRPADRLGQAGMVGVPRGDGAREPDQRAPGWPLRCRRDPAGDRPAPFPSIKASRSLPAKGDQVQWGGRTLMRMGALRRRTARRTSLPCRSRAEPRAADRLRAVDAARQAVQLDDPARRRSADRRRAATISSSAPTIWRACGSTMARRSACGPNAGLSREG